VEWFHSPRIALLPHIRCWRTLPWATSHCLARGEAELPFSTCLSPWPWGGRQEVSRSPQKYVDKPSSFIEGDAGRRRSSPSAPTSGG
jgi:hypothetical protein